MRSVSVVMPTFNSIRTIDACLKSVREQDYGGKVEIVVADGGSSDGTVEILKKYKCRVIGEKTGNPEKAKAIVLRVAKEEMILLIASDNVLPEKNWLSKMVKVLESEPKLVAVYPWRYEARRGDSSLNRYYALMGANDPVARYLGKADRQSWESKRWRLSGEAVNKGGWWQVRFNKDNMPTLGDNGVLVWREKLMKAKVDEKHFSHIDVFWDLVNMGEVWFGVVKNTIVHDTGDSLVNSLKKRYRYMTKLYLEQKKFRRFVWVRNFNDALKIIGYCIYSITLIGPILESILGFISKPDFAWFWHPVVCVTMVFIYGKAVLHEGYPAKGRAGEPSCRKV
ncbi:glycosyltransferase family 2 protein [Patescibacteria group bacterium]|nr:glycosyltransferase family 2 protein [Patescibacteria group bacterium]